VAVLMVVWLFLWLPVLIGQSVPYMRDLTFFALPIKSVWVQQVLAGKLPLWTSAVSNGMPFLADLSTQSLYPLNVLFLLGAPVQVALGWFVAVHQGLAMLAATWLMRVLRVSPWWAVGMAVAYGCSGYVLSITDNINFLPATAWLPVALGGWLLALHHRKPVYTLVTGVVVALMLLAGDVLMPLVVGFGLVFTAVVALAKPLVQGQFAALAPLWQFYLRCAGWFSLGAFALPAVQLLPTAELMTTSVRRDPLKLAEVFEWSFAPQRLWELVTPYLFGNKYPQHAFMAQYLYPRFKEPWANSVFIGLLPMLGAAVAVAAAVWQGKHKALVLGVVAFVVVSLLLSFGDRVGLSAWLVQLLTLLHSQRYLEKLLLPATLGLCVLAALGLSTLWQQKAHTLKPAWLQAWPGWLQALLAVCVLGLGAIGLAQLPFLLWVLPFTGSFNGDGVIHPVVAWQAHGVALTAQVALPLAGALLWWLWPSPAGERLALWRTRLGVVLMIASLAHSVWVNRLSIVTMPASLVVAGGQHAETPKAHQAIAQQQTTPTTARVFYDDSIQPPEYYAHVPLLDQLGQAYGLPSRPEPYEVYWAYRVLYNMHRGLYNSLVTASVGVAPQQAGLPKVVYQNGRYSPLQPQHHNKLDELFMASNPIAWLEACGVSHILTTEKPINPKFANHPRLTLVHDDEELNLRILALTHTQPRAKLATHPAYNTQPYVFKWITTTHQADPLAVEINLPALPTLPPVASNANASTLKATMLRDEAGLMEVATQLPAQAAEANKGWAWLVLTESHAPHWQATLADGSKLPVAMANHRFLAVAVPAGQHTVTLRYTSPLVGVGLALSALSLLLIVGLLLKKRRLI
jgi:hypothetical protein